MAHTSSSNVGGGDDTQLHAAAARPAGDDPTLAPAPSIASDDPTLVGPAPAVLASGDADTLAGESTAVVEMTGDLGRWDCVRGQ